MTKILVTEDERDIRELIAFTLRFAGYEVVTAENGEEGVQLAGQEKPDMILMDVRMPKLTGYEACARIKADPALADIPVVFLSAKGQEAEIRTGLDAGGYLEETLLHSHFSFLHRSLSPLAVIDLADLVVRQSFSQHGKLVVESPLPDDTIESTFGSSMQDQFSAIGYRKFVEVRQPPQKDGR